MEARDFDLLLGCDPEVFVFDTETEAYVSAHGMVEGTKEEPKKVDKGMVQVDGMALEFGIDPVNTEEDWVESISSVFNTLKQMVGSRYELHASSMVSFSDEIMRVQPEEALALGCEPDFDAYTQSTNPPPVVPPLLANCRSGGGHVHFGWASDLSKFSRPHVLSCSTLAAQLDYYLALNSLSWDAGSQRRKIYGKRGCFRPTSYGMEYRTLSNEWLNTEETMRKVYKKSVEGYSSLLCSSTKFNKGITLYGGKLSFNSPRDFCEFAEENIDYKLTGVEW
jgi:hypothetical protein